MNSSQIYQVHGNNSLTIHDTLANGHDLFVNVRKVFFAKSVYLNTDNLLPDCNRTFNILYNKLIHTYNIPDY